jgi:hypothetical protein
LVVLGAGSGLAQGKDPASVAGATVKELSRYPAHRLLAEEPLAQAERALRRARDARAAGDLKHALQLEQTALEWAYVASDLVRAAAIEREAARLQQQAAEAETKLVRAQALLEETTARRSLAQQKLRELEGAEQPAQGGKP